MAFNLNALSINSLSLSFVCHSIYPFLSVQRSLHTATNYGAVFRTFLKNDWTWEVSKV